MNRSFSVSECFICSNLYRLQINKRLCLVLAPARLVYFKVGESGKGFKAKIETRLARRSRGKLFGLSWKGGGRKDVF